jgi:hypothetical protein
MNSYLKLLMRRALRVVEIMILLVLEHRLRRECEALASRRIGIHDARRKVRDNIWLAVLRARSE